MDSEKSFRGAFCVIIWVRFLCDKRKPPTDVGGFQSLRVCGLLLVRRLLVGHVVALGDGGAGCMACDGSLKKCREVDAQ